ncbi:PREDICTED: uncharacterized protein LOC108978886 [Bactrocera latifrons]|uniref:uncharacterized protein LOC108978886 n=1 Tax=Bactrocera latifrons TaxID=174628 RepID=UPI0008DD6941|nr:PREDICTED: uncharacterized protein LOC108978886 [Bactrocera latifrons]
MNDFGFIDYKKPSDECKDDMRTSTYRSHVYMTDTMMGNHMHAKFKEPKPYSIDPTLEKLRTSDYKANYTWKYDDPNKVINPSLGPKVQLMKNYEDRRLRFISRPMRPASSTMHQDFLWNPQAAPAPPTPITLPSPVAASKVIVNRAKPSFSKLLDPAATTSRLSFVHYTPAELMGSVARHDNITFWNWPKYNTQIKRVFPGRDDTQCDDKAARECPKRHCEFPSLVQHVPNSGMTTEVRANYIEPIKRTIDFETAHIHNRLVYEPVTPLSKETEYKVYGSGERTLKYV